MKNFLIAILVIALAISGYFNWRNAGLKYVKKDEIVFNQSDSIKISFTIKDPKLYVNNHKIQDSLSSKSDFPDQGIIGEVQGTFKKCDQGDNNNCPNFNVLIQPIKNGGTMPGPYFKINLSVIGQDKKYIVQKVGVKNSL